MIFLPCRIDRIMGVALCVKSMHFYIVIATLTQLRREAGKVLSAVLHRNKTVKLTQHGKAVAEIRPRPALMAPDKFARLWRDRRPLGQEVAAEVGAALDKIDAAK